MNLINTISKLLNHLTGQVHTKSFFGAIAASVIGGMMNKKGSKAGAPARSFTKDFTREGGLFGGSGFNNGNIQSQMSAPLSNISDLGLQGAGLFGQ